MAAQMLRQMIDERLQIQDAKRLGLKATDGEMQQRFSDIERAAGMSRGAVKQYWVTTDNGGCPTVADLVEARTLDEDSPRKDPWGKPWRIECSEDRVSVGSNGPDQKPDTEDDIRVPPLTRGAGSAAPEGDFPFFSGPEAKVRALRRNNYDYLVVSPGATNRCYERGRISGYLRSRVLSYRLLAPYVLDFFDDMDHLVQRHPQATQMVNGFYVIDLRAVPGTAPQAAAASRS